MPSLQNFDVFPSLPTIEMAGYFYSISTGLLTIQDNKQRPHYFLFGFWHLEFVLSCILYLVLKIVFLLF